MARFRRKRDASKHHHVVGGKRVVVLPGTVVECEEWEMPEAFMDGYERLDPPPPPEPFVPKISMSVVKRRDGRGYDVLNDKNGKPLNDVPLTQDEAYDIACTTMRHKEDDGTEAQAAKAESALDDSAPVAG